MVKNLVAVGCSYTEDIYPFPVWPEILSKKLNLNCYNLGSSGSGNEYIFSRSLDALHTIKNIGILVVMWSEFQRTDWQKINGQWTNIHFNCGDVLRNREKWKNDMMEDLRLKGYDNKISQINRSLRFMYSLQTVAKSLKIPFVHLVGCDPCLVDEQYIAGKTILDSPYFDKINMLGWPMLDNIGGWTIDTWLDNVDGTPRYPRTKSKLRISKEDSHPNKEGHERIANKLYKEIKNGGI